MGVNIPRRKKEALCYFGGVDRYIDMLEEETNGGYENFHFDGRIEKQGWHYLLPLGQSNVLRAAWYLVYILWLK